MSTLDNYIAESVSEDVSVGDIYVEQALAQLNVAYSLVASYAKDVAYVEYMAEMNGVDIYQEGFFTESDEGDGSSDDGKKEPGKLKKFGKSILSGPGKIWSFIKAAATAVATAATNLWRFITEKSLKTCIKKLEADKSGSTYKIPSRIEEKFGYITFAINDFADNIAKFASNNPGDNFEYKVNEAISWSAHMGLKEVSSAELVSIIKKITSADVANKLKESIKSLKDTIKKSESAYKKSGAERSDIKQYKASNATLYKDFYKASELITKSYQAILKDLKHVSNQVLKDVKKNNKNSGGGNPEPPKNDDDGDEGGDE